MISGDGSCATGDTGSCVLNSPVPSSGSTVGRPARVARGTDSKRGPGSISARSASANRTRLRSIRRGRRSWRMAPGMDDHVPWTMCPLADLVKVTGPTRVPSASTCTSLRSGATIRQGLARPTSPADGRMRHNSSFRRAHAPGCWFPPQPARPAAGRRVQPREAASSLASSSTYQRPMVRAVSA